MGTVVRPWSPSSGDTIVASDYLNNLDTIYNEFNGNIDNNNIKAAAGISLTKISLSDDATFTGDISFTNSATTDDVVTITGSSLTTGSALAISSNSASTSKRNLLNVANRNSASLATSCIAIQNAASGCALAIAAAGDGPHIRLLGDPDVSPGHDGDLWFDGTDLKFQKGTSDVILSSGVIQMKHTRTGAVATTTTTISADDSIPQQTEGGPFMILPITPTSTTSSLKIDVVFNYAESTADQAIIALFQDGTANALAAVINKPVGGGDRTCVSFSHFMTSGTVAETVFKVRAGPQSGTLTFNGTGGVRQMGGVMASSLTVTEYYP